MGRTLTRPTTTCWDEEGAWELDHANHVGEDTE